MRAAHPHRNRSRHISALATLLVCMLAVHSAPAQPTPPIGPDGGYLKDSGGSRVLVFVHGFSSAADTAWRCDPNPAWPAMVAADPNPAFASTDVYVLGYKPPPRRGKTATAGLEASIVVRMQAAGVFSRHSQVIFVAHAMGGLLIQQILEVNAGNAWTAKVRALFLYATPQEGPKLYGLGRYIDFDPRLKELEAAGDNFLLPSFIAPAALSAIPHFCLYQTLSDDGFSTVDRLSATRGCTAFLALHANRTNIVQPCQTGAPAYTFLVDKLRALQFQDTSAPSR